MYSFMHHREKNQVKVNIHLSIKFTPFLKNDLTTLSTQGQDII